MCRLEPRRVALCGMSCGAFGSATRGDASRSPAASGPWPRIGSPAAWHWLDRRFGCECCESPASSWFAPAILFLPWAWPPRASCATAMARVMEVASLVRGRGRGRIRGRGRRAPWPGSRRGWRWALPDGIPAARYSRRHLHPTRERSEQSDFGGAQGTAGYPFWKTAARFSCPRRAAFRAPAHAQGGIRTETYGTERSTAVLSADCRLNRRALCGFSVLCFRG